MRTSLTSLLRRPFVRSVLTVATGAAAVQAIGLLFAPFVARLYGPEAYGLQGIFVSVTGLLAVAAALGYPTAMLLPRQDCDARGLARLSLGIASIAAILFALALQVWGDALLGLLNAQTLADFTMLIPIAVLATVAARVLGQWLIRHRAYTLGAAYGALMALLVNSAKVGMGLLAPSALVLIAVNVIGGLLATVVTFLGWKRSVARRTENTSQRTSDPSSLQIAPAAPVAPQASMAALAQQYRDFPILRTPQDLINALSQAMPLLLLATFFGSAAAGFYAMALAVLAVPASVIGNSVMAVFSPRINDALHRGEDARRLIVQATAAMAWAGAGPFLLLLAFGPWLFEGVFGAAWRPAGAYAQCLAPWLFMQFINPPAVAAIPALRLQRGLLVYEVFSTLTKLAALWVGFRAFGDDLLAVALFSLCGVIAYAWLIRWVIRRSGDPSSIESRS